MPDPATPGRAAKELKATAYLMPLDPGVFCVFNTPGSAPPDPETGLPGVRLSLPPAGVAEGVVTLSGLDGDGWLSGRDDAALVRVTGGPAHVLVTVYQEAEGGRAAPQLQVMRLNGPVRTAQAPDAAPLPQAEVVAHVYGRGDVAGRLGEWIGERGSRRWIEGFALRVDRPEDVEYQAVLGRGWLSPWAEGGQFCGSRGMSLPILGLRVRLRGAAAETRRLRISATFVDGSSLGPVEDGEPCEAPGLPALEAFQVLLEPKRADPPRRAKPAAKASAAGPAKRSRRR